MRERSVLSDEHSVLLCVEVSRQVQLLLPDQGSTPGTSLVLVELPADPVIGTSVLLSRHIAVDFDHSSLDECDMLLFSQSA